LNQFFELNDIYQTIFFNQDIVALMMFIIHQTKLNKKLMTITCMQDHLDDARKLSLLNVQKLFLKEAIIANEITRNILNIY